MASWTLEGRGQRLTFEDWGLSEPVIHYASKDADAASFSYRGRWERQDDLFQYSDGVSIWKDDVKWFDGVVVMTPLIADAKEETIQYQVKGPWLFLEEHTYAVPWTSFHASDPAQIFCTHILMNAGAGGGLVSTRVQTLAILNFLLGLYLEGEKPFQLGDILPAGPLGDLYIPISEDRDRTCAQAVQHQLSWHRDVVTWFDYSTSPPTLHMKAGGSLDGFTVGLGDGLLPLVGNLRIADRPDLVRPSVVIRYERTNTINGTPRPAVHVDAWPEDATGREFGAWDATVDLRGFDKTTVRGSLVARNKHYLEAGWWRNHEPKLNSPNVDPGSLVFSDVKVMTPLGILGSAPLVEVGDPTWYPNPVPMNQELAEGTIAPWMELEDGTPVQSRDERITAKVKFDYYSGPVGTPGAILIESGVTMELSARITATNAPVGESSYEAVESIEAADPQPVGLARYLYDTVAPLYHSGSFVLTEPEVGGQARIGKRLYITGGKAEWATMNAIVQSVVEDIAVGVTKVTFGAPEHLGLQDLVDLLKVGRRRQRWTNPKTVEGEMDGDVEFGKTTANNDSGMGPATKSFMVLTPDNVGVIDGSGKQRADKVSLDAKSSAITIERKDKPGQIQLSLGTQVPATKPKVIITGDQDVSFPEVGSVIIDLSDLAAVPQGARVLRLREVCVKVGTEFKKMVVLGSVPY